MPQEAPVLPRRGPRLTSCPTARRAKFCDVGPHAAFSECGVPAACSSSPLSLGPSSYSAIDAPREVGAERGYTASLSSGAFQMQGRGVISSAEALTGSWTQTHACEGRGEGPQKHRTCRIARPKPHLRFGVAARLAMGFHRFRFYPR